MKSTGLPCDWSTATVGEIAAPVRNAIADGPFGSNLKLSDYVDVGVPVLQGKNITDDKFQWFDVRFIAPAKADELRRSRVRVGDILVVKIGSIGYSAVIPDLHGFETAIIPANLAKITPDPHAVDTEYLHRWLSSPSAKRYLIGAASKTAQPALSLTKIKNLPVPLPPLPEQRRIAAILDRAEALRTKRRAAIAQLDTLAQSIFLDMFGDPLENPKGLRTALLSSLCTRITDGTHQPPKWSATGNPFLFVSNITSGEIAFQTEKFISDETHAELTRRCPIEVGDVLYSTVGSYGVPAVVRSSRKFAFQRHIAHLKPNNRDIDSEFLREMLASPPLRQQANRAARGAAQKTVNLADIKNFVVFWPSMSQQHEFSRHLAVVGKLRALNWTSLQHLEILFASLQHRAFRGEL